MNLYETVKASVRVPEAAERYGLDVGRSGMTRCVFHDDRHPSMKLNEDYFYCFGCGEHGDVIDLTARLFGLSSRVRKEARLRLRPLPGQATEREQAAHAAASADGVFSQAKALENRVRASLA